jgi:hypothetical protein
MSECDRVCTPGVSRRRFERVKTKTMRTQHQRRKQGYTRILSLVVAITTVISWATTPTYAQSDDITGLVDAFAPDPINDTPEVVADEAVQFNKAEQALSQGLTNTNAPTRSFPSPAQIREVVNNKPVAPAPGVRRVKSPHDDLAFLDGEVPEVAPAASQPAQPRRPVIQEPKATAKQAKAPAIKDSGLSEKLAQSENRSKELERQLSEAKGQLAAAELEISRLSSIIESHSRARLNLPDNSASRKAHVEHVAAPAPRAVVHSRAVESMQVAGPTDLQVATITVEKADLRLGPGKNHSALMSLRRGSRLAVEARQGEWYRVFAPNGQRAWIHSSLVRFGDGAVGSNDGSAVTVKGFDAKLK